MTEWPDAPRLTAALEKRADEIVPTDRRSQVMDGRPSDPRRTSSAVSVNRRGRRRGASSRRGPRGYLSIAAAVLLVVGASVAAGVAVDREDQSVLMVDTAEPLLSDAEPTQGAAATTAESRRFTPLQPCVGSDETPQQFELEADDGTRVPFVTTSAGEDGFLGFARFISLDELEPLDQAVDRHRLVPGERHQIEYVDVRGFASVAEFELFRDAMYQSLCIANVATVVGTGSVAARLAADIWCTAQGSPGIQGVVLIDAVPLLPTECRRARPVYLIGQTPVDDPAVQRWAFLQGCEDPVATVDASGNTITRWTSCDSTLVHVDTAGASAWSLDEVDGESLDRFITTIARLPR